MTLNCNPSASPSVATLASVSYARLPIRHPDKAVIYSLVVYLHLEQVGGGSVAPGMTCGLSMTAT